MARFHMDPNTIYVFESMLISMDGATQIRISEFEARRWYNSRACVWCFQGLQIPKRPTGQILHLGKMIAAGHTHTHTNVGQTGGDLSFRVPYLFQIHWPHGVFHQKMRSRNLQFLCSLWQLGFFLNVNFSSLKAPPALHSVAKCFAASTQHWCLWNNETSKTAGLCIGVEASFYGWCNANPDF